MPKIEITAGELADRINLNRSRMCEPFYDIDNVFADIDARWPGDKEGRALLSFVCLKQAGAQEVPCMNQLIKKLPSMLNEKGYLGRITPEFFEQQLSGHSWLLRGLCAYHELTGSSEVIDIANGIVENLYLPLTGKISDYPVNREGSDRDGGVDGHTSGSFSGWLLSTDTCCAFMSTDGLSHYYDLTGDERVRLLLDEMIETFVKIDKRAIRAQTHCTLTSARGMLRLYRLTKNRKYFDYAKDIFTLYTDFGMTYTYENLNWWGRPDSWTEPCAIVDSLILATEFYKITRDESYRTLAARIYHNGFASFQRTNGGAGTQKIVCETRAVLEYNGIEAKQCCTMRFGEGLLYLKNNRELLWADTTGKIEKDSLGRLFDGDILYAETLGEHANFPHPVCNNSAHFTPDPGTIPVSALKTWTDENGTPHTVHPLVRFYKLTDETWMNLKQRIVFN